MARRWHMTADTSARPVTGSPIVLIDASIYIHRGWQRWPVTRLDPSGTPSNALVGFLDTLSELLARELPSHVVCAFDTCGRHGLRNQLFPAYKQSRSPHPDVLTAQFPRCMAAAEALGLAVFGSVSVEADDIIGHFARLAQSARRPVTVISGDKDLAQFVGPDDSYWDFGKHPRQDARALERRLGVRPGQVADWLALSGDASDGIPGVPGVGPATAARLVRKWGSLETLFANLEGVAEMRFRGAQGVARLLAEHRQTVYQARQLTGLLDDPCLPSGLEVTARRTIGLTEAREILLASGMSVAQANSHAAAYGVARDDSCSR